MVGEFVLPGLLDIVFFLKFVKLQIVGLLCLFELLVFLLDLEFLGGDLLLLFLNVL